MAERLIGEYDREDQAPVTKEEFDTEPPKAIKPTKEEKNERTFPTKETLGAPTMYEELLSANQQAYVLTV